MNTEQDRAELLPCPFCGCAMSLSAVARDWWRITGGHNEDCILYDHRHDAPQTDYQKQALIEDWNRRAALQSQDAEDVADMFWDADDTEDCLYAYDEETAVERMVEKAWPTDFPLHFTLQRAVRLPSVHIKVTSMSECGTDIKYERDAIDHARRIEREG